MSDDWKGAHPQAADHQPYLDNMAAWRNTVASGIPAANFVELPHHEGIANFMVEHENKIRANQETTVAAANRVWEESLEVSEEPVEVGPHVAEIASDLGTPVTPKVADEAPFKSREELVEAAQGALSPATSSSDRPPRTETVRTVLDADGTFDPAEHNAMKVLDHLKGASVTEIVRVMFLERQGKARKGILGQEEDLIAKASKRDN